VNFVSNAIKYSPPGSLISTRISTIDEETLRIQVIDEGPGLSSEDAAKLFHPFQRLTPRPTANEDSCGLGLHIVKHIVELHGGRVWVDTALGQGSSFGMDLPQGLERRMQPLLHDAEPV
jgi:signal transduction histidine kinase